MLSSPVSRLGFSAALAALLAVLGCGVPSTPPLPGEISSQPPQRLITLAPSLTQTAFALGLGERVVGVGDYDQWPPEVASLPRLGGLLNPNLERMVALKPDLAVLLPSQADVGRRLEGLGIQVLILGSETLADVEAAFLRLGEACAVEERARAEVAAFHERLAPRPVAAGARVMVTLSRPAGEPAAVRIAGPGTFLDELLRRLGAENAFADAPLLYPQVGLEEVLARAPDVIVEIYPEAVEAAVAETLRRDWQRVAPQVPAVREGRIAVIGGSFTVVPGPRLPQLYEALALTPWPPPSPHSESTKATTPAFLKPLSHPSGRPSVSGLPLVPGQARAGVSGFPLSPWQGGPGGEGAEE